MTDAAPGARPVPLRETLVISPDDLPGDVRAVFNPAVVFDSQRRVVHIIAREISWDPAGDRSHPNPLRRGEYRGHLCHFVIDDWDGARAIRRLPDPRIQYHPSLPPATQAQLHEWQTNGVEDPRIVNLRVPDGGGEVWLATMVFLTRPAFTPSQRAITVSAVSTDLETFTVNGILTPPEVQRRGDDRDSVPFPS